MVARLRGLVVLLLLGTAPLYAQNDRGPWQLFGRRVDTTVYVCNGSTNGTRVPDNGTSLNDNSPCGLWAFGAGGGGTNVTLNGIPTSGFGVQILWWNGTVYVKAAPSNWYYYTGGDWVFFGTDDPQTGGGGSPVGYFVSTTGNDANSCMTATSQATPKRTVVSGLSCLSAGATLWVRGGSYDESILNTQFALQVASGTSWANKVRIASYPGETVWLRPTSSSISGVIWFVANSRYIEFDGINLDASNAGGSQGAAGIITGAIDPSSTMPDHIRIQNAEIIRAGQSNACITSGCGETDGVLFGSHEVESAIGANEAINLRVHGGNRAIGYGIYLSGPNNLVDGCEIYDTSSAGVHIYNGGGDSSDNNTVRNTRIHDIITSGQARGWGILIGGSNNKIYNNTVTGMNFPFTSTSAGIYVYSGNSNLIANNSVYLNAMPGLLVNGGQVGNIFRSNIAYQNTGGNYSDGGTSTVHTNNLEGVDPLFVSTTDLHLTSGSPARHIGFDLSATFTTDLTGATRSVPWDAGAYKF